MGGIGMPYRTPSDISAEPEPGVLTRLWRRVFGRLVYGGEPTCGHCKHWKPGIEVVEIEEWSDLWDKRVTRKKYEPTAKGDCALLFSHDGKETTKDDTCDRFKARRKYMHRIR